MSRLVETVSFRSALACRVVSKERTCRRGRRKLAPSGLFAPSGRRRLSLLAFPSAGIDGFSAGEAWHTASVQPVYEPSWDEEKVTTDTWSIGPVLKRMAELEDSVKKHPLIAMGTPDPYMPVVTGGESGSRALQ